MPLEITVKPLNLETEFLKATEKGKKEDLDSKKEEKPEKEFKLESYSGKEYSSLPQK